MESKYLLNIPELDAQDQEICEVIDSLSDAIGSHDKWHLIHYILVHLHELLRIHFIVEESFMRVVGYPDIEQHKQIHKALLDKVVLFKNDSLTGKGFSDFDVQAQQTFLSHILDHDKHFAQYLKTQYGSVNA